MILRLSAHISHTRTIVDIPTPKIRFFAPLLVLVVGLMAAALTGCTSESSNLGQYKKGRTLHFSVVSVERTPELRYTTCDVLAGSAPPVCDPDGRERDWAIAPSAEGMELVLVRARVENHNAVSAIIHVDRTGAELRDFANTVYRPIAVNESAWRDFRGASEALVRMNLGECFDGPRTLLDTGSAVRWQNEAEAPQYIDFGDAQLGWPNRLNLSVGGELSHTFVQPDLYSYTCGTKVVRTFGSIADEIAAVSECVCGDAMGVEWPAELWVAKPEVTYDYIKRTTHFLQGSLKLLQGHGLDGFLIFEAPIGTEFRDVRWRAGDSITFDF